MRLKALKVGVELARIGQEQRVETMPAKVGRQQLA